MESRHAALNLLRELSSFDKVSTEALTSLAAASRTTTVEAGHYVMIEGEEEPRAGFIVVSGRLALMKTSPSGRQLIVELLSGGDIFGLVATLASEHLPVQLSARAHQTTELLWIPVTDFVSVLNKEPIVYQKMVSYLLAHLHSSYRISRGLAHDRVEVRIAAVLASLALKYFRATATVGKFTIDITRQQIADLTGTTPETAIRTTRAMQRQGLIDISRPGIVKVLNVPELEEIGEGGRILQHHLDDSDAEESGTE